MCRTFFVGFLFNLKYCAAIEVTCISFETRNIYFQLTVEEYVQAMELLVNDVRFTMYNVCYKRILVVWVTIAFLVLLGLLFSGLTGLTLFGLGIAWLVLNAAAIFLSMYIKFRLQRNLEKCLANVNKQLLRHKVVIALDDRGKISCHKVNLCFIYMDSAPCIAHIQTSIDQMERDPTSGWEQRMDITSNDIIIQGNRQTRLSRKQVSIFCLLRVLLSLQLVL